MGTKSDGFTAEMGRRDGESVPRGVEVRRKGQEIVANRIGHRRVALVKVRVVWWRVRCGKKNRSCDDANEGRIRRTRWVIGTGYLST
jgi:hypothetical protein